MRLVGCRVFAFFVKATQRRFTAAMASTEATAMQRNWTKPEGKELPKLKLYNSLTRQKEEFVPLNGRRVLWYSCGPTVYDASHMGHARSYITFDILRRVLSGYFNYDIVYVMNVTDIDDKIIRRARRNHLLEDYVSKDHSLTDTIQHIQEALKPFRARTEAEVDPDKKAMLNKTLSGCELVLAGQGEGSGKTALLEAARDPLASWLDDKYGSDVTDHSIFAKLTRHWEEEYHKDMEALNVLPADVLTRVSSYVDEVVAYVQKIIDNGYGYESNGSVYFDVAKFSSAPDHTYAKLVPEAVGDLQALAEGEGELSVSDDRLREKRSRNDFALWKASKPGEPAWPSPWGQGRPGWHIECSVMACDILGEQADIHTGGVDLKFPHHDNEIAQAEACYGHDHWISYFLHAGHLTIEGCKMSKSLKNFITIKDALKKYSSRQLRLAFLLHTWNATLDYSEQTMREALYWEKTFNEFFLRVKDLMRKLPSGVDSYVKFGEREKQLLWKLEDSKIAVYESLCDSIDTVAAMKVMKELVGSCNVYLGEGVANARLLELVGLYLTDMMKVFGVVPDSTRFGFPVDQQATDEEAVVVPFASLLAEFREQVRKIALENKTTPLLQLCDKLRDDHLPDLGVLLEDRDGQTVVKYVGKEAVRREKENARKLLEEKERIKLEQKMKTEAAKRAREEAAAISPNDMFRNQTDKYSQFDEQGIPTHYASGEAITDSQRKKLRKQWQAQEKKHKDYLAKNQ